jgi:hypothetical protein
VEKHIKMSEEKDLYLNDINLRLWQSTTNERYGVLTSEFSASLAEGMEDL